MKKILLLAFASILLLGCNSTKPSTTTCTLSDDSDIIIIDAVGDDLEMYTDKYSIDVNSYSEEQQQSFLNDIKSSLDTMIGDSVGTRYEAYLNNGVITASVYIIPKLATAEELETFGFASDSDYSSFSVKSTIESIESEGYTCDRQYEK